MTLGWRPAIGLLIPGREHWRLVEQLGSGAIGEVWLAAHDKTHARRVFKFCFEAARVRGLKREVVLLRLLRERLGERRDIAQVLDWEFERPPFFLETAYTEAGDLLEWSSRKGGIGAVPLTDRIEIAAQAAEALAAAHEAGILHKDLKPSNLLISEAEPAGGPRVCLTDFGIGLVTSRDALSSAGVTVAGMTETLLSSSSSSTGAGTRLYMAPEVIEGRPATERSDVYGLGVVLYQMAIGDFSRALAPGWERAVADDVLREDIAAAVDGDAAHRLGSARELATRLRDLEQRRVERHAHERGRIAAETSGKRRRVLLVAGAVALLLVVVGALLPAPAARAPRRARARRAGALGARGGVARDRTAGSGGRLRRRIRAGGESGGGHPDRSRSRRAVVRDLRRPGRCAPSRRERGSRCSPTPATRTPSGRLWANRRSPRSGCRAACTAGGSRRKDTTRWIWCGGLPTTAAPTARILRRSTSSWCPPARSRPAWCAWPAARIAVLVVRFRRRRRRWRSSRSSSTASRSPTASSGTSSTRGGYGDDEHWLDDPGRAGASRLSSTAPADPAPPPGSWGPTADGEDDLPVGGVSWYEAQAYCRFRGKSLPTVYHWARAAFAPMERAAADFGRDHPGVESRRRRAGPGRAATGAMAAYGAYDMAGNVKEWASNATADGRRYLVGGAWNEPGYMFYEPDAQPPVNREPNLGFRCMALEGGGPIPEQLAAPVGGARSGPQEARAGVRRGVRELPRHAATTRQGRSTPPSTPATRAPSTGSSRP